MRDPARQRRSRPRWLTSSRRSKSYRTTAISALAIPLSAIPTFAFMQWMGFTLNQVSLLALSLLVVYGGYVWFIKRVVVGPSPEEHRVWTEMPEAGGAWQRTPAVSPPRRAGP